MGGDGLRNILKTRTYRERSQPGARSHLGLLEKKKDYKLRAKDYHRKEDAIKKLRNKATLKNPDEFYFKMTHTQMEGGVHRKQAAKQPTNDDMKDFKREDANYLMLKQTAEAKKVERLRASLHMLDAPLRNKHAVFVDSAMSASSVDPSARGATPAEAAAAAPLRRVVGTAGPSSTGDAEGETGQARSGTASGPRLTKKAQAKLDRANAEQYDELAQRVARHDKMGRALQRIGIEKALLGKGARKKIKKGTAEGGTKVFKFRQRRKK